MTITDEPEADLRAALEQARSIACALEQELAQVRSLLNRVSITFLDEYDDHGSGRVVPGSDEAVAQLQEYRRTGLLP